MIRSRALRTTILSEVFKYQGEHELGYMISVACSKISETPSPSTYLKQYGGAHHGIRKS